MYCSDLGFSVLAQYSSLKAFMHAKHMRHVYALVIYVRAV